MNITIQTLKKLVVLASVFFLSYSAKAQDLIGIYNIQRATDGVLNRNIGTVEIKQLVYRDTSRTVRMKKTEYNEIRYYDEWGQPQDFHEKENDQIVRLSDGYHIVYTNIRETEYQYIETFGDQVTKRIITINGNGSGTYNNEVDISSPLTSFKNYTQVTEELSKGKNSDSRTLFNEYLWSASLEPGVIVRKHLRDKNIDNLCDITELLVKQGSVQEQNGWVMSQWLIDLTKPFSEILENMSWTDNLNVSKFTNGEIIPQAKSVAEWQTACKAKKPVWCFYKFNPANGAKFAKIYNYYAVIDKRGLAPIGFHIATESDFDLLKSILSRFENNEYDLTDKFKGQFGGYFNGTIFDLAEEELSAGEWWTSTTKANEILVYELIQHKGNVPNVENGTSSYGVQFQEFKKNWRISQSKYSPQNEGYSVRCVKDK